MAVSQHQFPADCMGQAPRAKTWTITLTIESNMYEKRKLERKTVSTSLEVYDLDTGNHLGRVVDLHAEGLMLLSDRPIDLYKHYALQVSLPMTLNGLTEFFLDAESLWNRESLAGGQYWTGLHFTQLPEASRTCIEKMVASR
ncbi:PilZ domain-containing protein [Halopseudomonas salina]|nr:PilZ domain-containing protein [Halopseudomonas salina]